MSIRRLRILAASLTAAGALALAVALPASALGDQDSGALNPHQRAVLLGIAADTWRFYTADVDSDTHLPLDNLGPADLDVHRHGPAPDAGRRVVAHLAHAPAPALLH